MSNIQYYVGYTADGDVKLYNQRGYVASDVVGTIKITNYVHAYIMKHLPYIKLDMNAINFEDLSDESILMDDELDAFVIEYPEIDIAGHISNIISSIKNTCKSYIFSGVAIDEERYTFTYEDQINIQTIMFEYKEGSAIYYHSSGNGDRLFTYGELRSIYVKLYNNKLYHQLYTNILCKYIKDNYTIDSYNDKLVIEYGFMVDEIENELEEKYNEQRLQ